MIRPPIFEGVGVTLRGLRREIPFTIEDARAVPRTEGLRSGRWCDGGRGAGGGVNGGAESRRRGIDGVCFQIGGTVGKSKIRRSNFSLEAVEIMSNPPTISGWVSMLKTEGFDSGDREGENLSVWRSA